MTDMGRITRTRTSIAYGINNSGQVVGYTADDSQGGGVSRPFVISGGEVRMLLSLQDGTARRRASTTPAWWWAAQQ